MRKSFPGESSMLSCFLKESEIYSVLPFQIIQNIHSATEESSEDIFMFIDQLVILVQLASIEYETHTMQQNQMSLKIPDFNIIWSKTQLEMEPGSPILFCNWSIDYILETLQTKDYR